MTHRDANSGALRCYRCGTSLAALSLPLSRLDLCPDCSVELHVCRMCRHYAPALPEACDEDDATEVRNKTAANFYDYFLPHANAFDGREQSAEAVARQQLEALFGSGEPAPGEEGPGAGADAETAPDDGTGTSADSALAAAEKLFRK